LSFLFPLPPSFPILFMFSFFHFFILFIPHLRFLSFFISLPTSLHAFYSSFLRDQFWYFLSCTFPVSNVLYLQGSPDLTSVSPVTRRLPSLCVIAGPLSDARWFPVALRKKFICSTC
jgi:hypothetical protein